MAKRNIIHFYKKHDSLKELCCFYCGGHAESLDHVPPISYPDIYEESERFIVRCCLLCNTFLHNKMYLTFLARNEYLLIKYQKRFKKLLSMPPWSQQEIDELEGKLKREIIQSIKKKKHIENKILFIKQNITFLRGY